MQWKYCSLVALVSCTIGVFAVPAPAEDLKEIYSTVEKLEKSHLGSAHSSDLLDTRLNRLDKKVFGEVQSGSARERIDALTVKAPQPEPEKPHSEPAELKSHESVAAEKQTTPEKPSSEPAKEESNMRTEAKPDSEINWPAYISKATRLLKANWSPPKYEGTNRKVDLVLRIAKDGTIEHVRVSKTSGFQELDYSALQSSKEVGKLPPLPEGARAFVDIQVTFDQALKSKSGSGSYGY